MAKIIFDYGVTRKLSYLPENSIALDGYVQGPEIDNIGERYSFDHHAGCIRFCTLSTVQQVHLALSLGLLVGEDTKVFANMLDADTVMSVWLLENAWRKGLVQAPHVIQAVTEIGIVDSHGPIFVVHPLHEYGVIAPAPWQREKQTTEELMRGLSVLDSWYEGGKLPAPIPRKEIEAVAWFPGNGVQALKTSNGFSELYQKGALAGILIDPVDGSNTTMYTVGKKSEFVPVKIGPGSDRRPVEDVTEYKLDTFLGALASAEIQMNPKQGLAENWGGATTVGGSPRNADKSSSVLPPSEVVRIFRRFLPGL